MVFESGEEAVCEPVKDELKGFESISHSASGSSLSRSAGGLPRTNEWIRLSKQVESKYAEGVISDVNRFRRASKGLEGVYILIEAIKPG